MTWTKIGNELLRESRSLSDAAYRLHINALMWSNWYLLDLTIPSEDFPLFAGLKSANINDAVRELIDTGWWQQIDDDTYWIGCRFPEWQQDKAQIEHRRAQLALAQRRKRLHDVGDHKLCIAGRCKVVSTVESTVESCDDPVRYGTERLREPPNPAKTRGRVTNTPDGVSPNGHGEVGDAEHWAAWTGGTG